jgi:hypothetical protein
MRRFHARGDGEAECRFDVRRAPGPLHAVAAKLFGVPAPSDCAHVALRVRVDGEREHWTRIFPDQVLRSVQWLESGRLTEQFGLVRLTFDVEADETGMRMASRRCRVAGIPLPRALAPAIAATARGDANTWEVEVTIAMPLLGNMLSYGGEVIPT